MAGVTVVIDSKDFQRRLRIFNLRIAKKGMLNAIGIDMLAWMLRNISKGGTERKFKPLKPNTILKRRGGSSNPLLDKGGLRQSFVKGGNGNIFRLSGNQVTIGSNHKLAEIHHKGTRSRTITPRTKKFLAFPTVDGTIVLTGQYSGRLGVLTKQVSGHKIPARKLMPSSSLAKRIAEDTVRALVDRAVKEANA